MASFTPAGSGGAPSVSSSEIVSYTVANVSVPTASTEVEIIVPVSAVLIHIQNRTDGLTKLAFGSGLSFTTYVTIWPGDSHEYAKQAGTSMSLFVQCPKASQVLEITYGHQ